MTAPTRFSKGKALAALALAIGAVSAIVAACETPLPQPYALDAPRVLAIQSNPVELAPDGAVNLQALIYVPPGSPQPSYQWSWCAGLNTTLQCSVTATELTTLLDPDGTLGVSINYALGGDAGATLGFPVDPSVIQAACSRRLAPDGSIDTTFDASAFLDEDAEAGLPFDASIGGTLGCRGDQLTLYAVLTATVGSQTLQAVRDLTVDSAPPTSTNTNPTVVGLLPITSLSSVAEAGPFGDPGGNADGGIVDAGVGALNGGVLTLAAVVPLSATDFFPGSPTPNGGFGALSPFFDAGCTPDDDGGCAAQLGYEGLSLAWYVQGGTLLDPTTTMRGVPQGSPQDWHGVLVNQWALPTQPGTYTVILVARDTRGGVGWLVQPVNLPLP